MEGYEITYQNQQIMTKEAETLSRKLVAELGPKPGPPLRWLHLTVLGILCFVVCNEVDSPDQQVRLEQLRLAHKLGREDRFLSERSL